MAGADRGQTPSSVDMAASSQNAALLQHQWDDYKARFQPEVDKLVSQMGTGINTQFGADNVAKAGELTNQAFDTAQASQNRDLSRYGQGLSDLQVQSQKGNYDLAKTAASANATNTAQQADVDMRNEVMSGGLGNVGKVASPM